MYKSVLLLTKLQICNLFSLNETKYAKDKSKKSRLRTTLFAFIILGATLIVYSASLSAALAGFGFVDIVPLYLGTMAFSIIFSFSVFRVGAIFDVKSYEKLAVLPVPQSAIVASKFLTLYVTNFLFSFVVMVSGAIATCVVVGFDLWFLLSMVISSVFLPLLAITLALLIGTVIYAIVSRFKKNSFLKTALTTILVVAVVMWPSMLDSNATDLEFVEDVAALFSSIGNVFAPLAWMGAGTRVSGIGYFFLFILSSVAVFVGYSLLVGKFYKNVCSALSSKTASANFKMSEQTAQKPVFALYKREFKRYISCSIYFMNTAMGNILAIVLAVSVAFVGVDSVLMELGIPAFMVTTLAPFMIALVNNLSPLTASAISMEGKGFEQTKALPVSSKTVMDAKLLLQYTFSVPACLICSTSFAIALGVKGFDILWIYVIPLALSVLLGALGLFVNAKLPCLSWDNASVPVKQSSSVLVSMLSAMAIVIVSAVVMVVVGEQFKHITSLLFTLLYAFLVVIMYKKLSNLRLNAIDEE